MIDYKKYKLFLDKFNLFNIVASGLVSKDVLQIKVNENESGNLWSVSVELKHQGTKHFKLNPFEVFGEEPVRDLIEGTLKLQLKEHFGESYIEDSATYQIEKTLSRSNNELKQLR